MRGAPDKARVLFEPRSCEASLRAPRRAMLSSAAAAAAGVQGVCCHTPCRGHGVTLTPFLCVPGRARRRCAPSGAEGWRGASVAPRTPAPLEMVNVTVDGRPNGTPLRKNIVTAPCRGPRRYTVPLIVRLHRHRAARRLFLTVVWRKRVMPERPYSYTFSLAFDIADFVGRQDCSRV